MDAQRFIAEFGYVANAPNGVDRLRDMILELAIQGRLTDVATTSESAETLLAEIREWRALSVASTRRSRASISSLPIFDFEKKFPIPDSWIWVRQSDVFGLVKGKNPNDLRSEGGKYAYLDVEALDRGNILRYTDDESAARSTAEDILVVCDGSRSGLILDGRDGVIGSTLARIDTLPKIHPFVKLLFRRNYRKLNAEKRGAAIPHLDIARLLADACALPPLRDQKEIVAKVDELMTLCDSLEQQQQDGRKLQNALRQSVQHALTIARDPHERKTAWSRLSDNFARLFSAPEDVVQLKGLILDLAVSGLLVQADSEQRKDSKSLLQAIAVAQHEWAKHSRGQEQKEALATLKKLRNQDPQAPKLTLPDHWSWASLLQVAQAIVDCHNKTAPYVGSGIHLVRTTDIRDGMMDLTKTKKISEETYAYWSRRLPPRAGDIFFTREAPMGEAAIVPVGPKVCLGQRTMLIRLFPELFNNRFLLYVIRSPSFQNRMREAAIGMTVKHLRVGGVEDLMIPVPPKEEQDRIVAVVDWLFQICDTLAGQLDSGQKSARQMAIVIVAALTGVAIEEEEEPVKAPKTVLFAPLHFGKSPGANEQAPLAGILSKQKGGLNAKDLWQRYGGDIDSFYAQLKTEVANGWIREPDVAEVNEIHDETVSA